MVPLLSAVPIPLYHSAPLARMGAIFANVSTLLTVLGLAKSPAVAGKGGFSLGFGSLPSSTSNAAESSPAT